ncbi:uncharacterized protein YunC (DUF1805 family) [Paenibacillus sp. PastF-3]|nr:uncharacterized protein YunC (DUF1805 family) [Paenibacillus sp. PastF-3]
MIMMKPIEVEGHQVISIEVALPKTTLLAITTDHGYIMCGALDIRLLNEKLNDRRIVAGRATGVRTISNCWMPHSIWLLQRRNYAEFALE